MEGPMRIVTAAVIRKSDTVLLTRRKPGEKLAGMWEFPGGKIELGESPEECLKRELKEELGIEVKVGAHIADSLYEYDHGAFLLKAYETEHISGEFQLTVHDDIKWVKPENLLAEQLAPADIALVEHLRG